jgi:hypothetical protein
MSVTEYFLIKCIIPSQRRFNDIFKKQQSVQLKRQKKKTFEQTANDMSGTLTCHVTTQDLSGTSSKLCMNEFD